MTDTEQYPTRKDKRLTEDQVVAQLSSGMTLGIGGWGSRRKPMSLVRAILRSDLTDLHLVTYGGPEVGMLCAAGKVSHLTFAFVAPDNSTSAVLLEPHFRAARQSGAITCTELDEGMLGLGLQAAAWRVPFLPTRVGLGSDLHLVNPDLRTVTSPYPGPDGQAEELIAQPAIRLDASICHLNVGDDRGNAAYTGPDLYYDDLLLEAADRRFISVERIVPTGGLVDAAGDIARLRINRLFVDGIVEAPNGAHPTECAPDYPRDLGFQKAYLATAKDPADWEAFRTAWLSFGTEAEYQAALAARPAEEGGR